MPKSSRTRPHFFATPGAALFALVVLSGTAPYALADGRRGPPHRTEPVIELEAAAGLGLARRKGSPACWASLATNQGEFCLRPELWGRWLSQKTPLPLEGRWRGRWQVVSPPANLVEERKTVLRRFRVEALPEATPRGTSALLGLRQELERLREKCSTRLAPFDPLGIFRQLLLNEKVPESPGGMLRALGFVHLLSATGIHLYAMADLWSALLRSATAILGLPVRVGLPMARALSFLSWLFAWALAGGRLGMLRPWLIVVARNLAEALGFRWRRWSPLALALLADLAAETLAASPGAARAHSQGRILYALAVGGGMMALRQNSGEARVVPTLQNHARLAVGSWAFTALWEAWHGGLIALATPVLSLLTIPFFSLVLFPSLCLAALEASAGLPLSSALGSLWKLSSGATLWLAHKTMSLELLWQVRPGALLLGAGLAAVSLAIFAVPVPANSRRQWVRKTVVTAAIVTGLLAAGFTQRGARPEGRAIVEDPPRAELIRLLDVGQGDATWVRDSRGRTGLIDAGPERALSEEAWLRLLASHGSERIHWIALTHLNEDHAGGVKKLARIVPIDCVATSRQELSTENGRRFTAELGALGIRVMSWEEGCYEWPVLYPETRTGKPGRRRREQNARMSVLWVPLVGGGGYLATGDASAEDELRASEWLLRFGAEPAQATARRILKVSHHGSRFSTSSPFLRRFRPTEAWVSAGVGNTYGHPSSSVLERLARHGIQTRRTDLEGAIINH
ncbi:MAG: MBL fold metallo-hydrolase [Oligoflexia bacterium]|nr:MBL fold metallo-hydrolase [Oligoflexia bacterium]